MHKCTMNILNEMFCCYIEIFNVVTNIKKFCGFICNIYFIAQFCECNLHCRWVCTSGDPGDLDITDEIATSVLEDIINKGGT